MEHNNKLITRNSIEQSLLVSTQSKTNEVSIYHDAKAEDKDVKEAIVLLNGMFTPQTNDSFIAMFARQVKQAGMTRQQLSDAVDLLARTNRYNTWKIADIVSFNSTIHTYSQNEIYKEAGQFPSPYFPKVKIADREVHVKLEDADNYHLQIVRDYKEYL